MRRAYMPTENQQNINTGGNPPLVKVLESLENFFKKFSSRVWDRVPRSYCFYPVAERAAVAAMPIPLDGIGRGAAGNSNTENGYPQNLYNGKDRNINPIVLKFLKFLKTSFKKFLSRVRGKAPRSLGLRAKPQGLPHIIHKREEAREENDMQKAD